MAIRKNRRLLFSPVLRSTQIRDIAKCHWLGGRAHGWYRCPNVLRTLVLAGIRTHAPLFSAHKCAAVGTYMASGQATHAYKETKIKAGSRTGR